MKAKSSLGKKESLWKKLGRIAIVVTIITGCVGIVVGAYEFYSSYETNHLSSKEVYDKTNISQGDLKPAKIPFTKVYFSKYDYAETRPVILDNKITNNYPNVKGVLIKDFDKKIRITLDLGGKPIYCKVSDFYRGIDVFKVDFFGYTTSKLIFGIKDDRIYVSTEFKDLEKEETIGVIDFNHWRVYNYNRSVFYNDERFEVLDKQNYVVFSIKYDEMSAIDDALIHVRGYFIDPYSVLVLTDPEALSIYPPQKNGSRVVMCMNKKDPNYKVQAKKYLNFTKSIFKLTQ